MITVLGASGFVGSHLVEYLQCSGIDFQTPARHEPLAGRDLGHIIYCIGLTADFRQRPFDAVDAHVSRLLDVVRSTTFESIVFLSSTRLYINGNGVAHEDDALRFSPLEFEDIYNLSKATGESIVLSLGGRGRVARLSNVYGARQSATFLGMILAEAKTTGAIALQTALESQKDYVSVSDTAALLVKIALHGRQRIYNVASGENLRHADVTAAIARLTGCSVSAVPNAPTAVFPRIDIERVRSEFGFRPLRLLDDLPSLIGRNV